MAGDPPELEGAGPEMSRLARDAERTFRVPEGLPALLVVPRIGQRVINAVSAALEPLALRPRQYLMLVTLDELGPTPQGELAEALGIDSGNFVAIVDALEGRGAIERQRDPSDRRRYLLGLRPAGRKLLRRANEITAETEREFLAPLDDGQREQLDTILRSLASRGEA